MSVQEYIDKHDLSKKVEEVINACVKAKPEEPISFMVRQTPDDFGVFDLTELCMRHPSSYAMMDL